MCNRRLTAGIMSRTALFRALCVKGGTHPKHLVAMSCKSSLCLRCAKVYVDNWVSQVSQMLHDGVIYRHIVLTVPALVTNGVSLLQTNNIHRTTQNISVHF